MYKEVKGDLIEMTKEGAFDVICHGANCLKNMEAGIAKLIKTNFIRAYITDRDDMRLSRQRLGDLSYSYDIDSDTYVVNLYTQYYGGKNLDYEALTLSLRKLAMVFNEDTHIGLPMIGCGIAGGDWDRVKSIIKEELKEYKVTIVML